MKRKSFFLLLLFILFFSYGLILNFQNVQIIPQKLHPPSPHLQDFFDYTGVIHIHSNRSSGSGTIKQIISVAQEAGLDFIILTDLNAMDVPYPEEGYHDNLLVFTGGEYSYLDSHLLNLFIKNPSHLKGPGRSQAFFADLLDKKNKPKDAGLLILAHPFLPGFQWTGPYPPGLDGIEVINLKSIWQDTWLHSKLSFFWTLFVYPFNPRLAFLRMIEGAGQKGFQLLDQLQKKHPLIAIGGADADAKIRGLFGGSIRFPSYSMLFNIVRQHVLLKSELTGQWEKDQQKISSAIEKGQFFISFDILANAKGFSAYIHNNNQKWLMGSRLPWSKSLRLKVSLPEKPLCPFEIVLYKDGQRVTHSTQKEVEFPLKYGRGAYRIYVRVIPTLPFPDGRKWLPWIFTNSFYLY
ncbi:MAG: hypothetical protein D6797_01240 [Bdellovibrio sp.]|nr:MAG: hypothetical protein D6797_01240 [Bdellovibrio sp.]